MATFSAGQIALVARGAGFSGNSLVTAVAVALAESSGRTDVVNSIGCVGLWQINQPVHISEHSSWTVSYLQDPSHNAQAAYALSNGGTNWNPWETYTNGAYKDHLTDAAQAVGQPAQAGGVANANPANWLTDIPGEIGGLIGDGANAVGGAVGSMLPSWVTDPQTWLRVAYVLVGGALVVGGLLVVARPAIEKTAATASKVGAVAAM